MKNVFLDTHVECSFLLFFRHVMNALQQQKDLTYCRKTKWICVKHESFSCSQCKRVIHTRLTLDGFRLKQQGKFVDENAEERKMNVLYKVRTRRRLRFN